MTGRADFTDEEWSLVSQAPTSAGLLVIASQRGGTFRETFSMARAYAEARKQQGSSELLDTLVSTKPERDRTRPHSPEELKQHSLQHLRDAVAVLEQKATPEELDDYRRFIIGLAQRVAEAHREGDQQVSDAERAAVAEVAEAVGGEAPA